MLPLVLSSTVLAPFWGELMRRPVVVAHCAQCRHVFRYLNKEGAQLGAPIEAALANVVETWEKVQKQVPVTKAAIAPAVRSQAIATKAQLVEYEVRMSDYAAAHRRDGKYWKWATGVEGARRAIDDAVARQSEESKILAEQKHLAWLFEMSDAVATAARVHAGIDEDLELARELWQQAARVRVFIEECRAIPWAEVDGDALEETARGLMKEMTSRLPVPVRWCDAYAGLTADVKNFVTTCPLVAGLKTPSVRSRHWDAVMKATGVTFIPPPVARDMTLGALLDLRLHEHRAALEEIADQAVKEGKMEATLERLDRTWRGVMWSVEAYKPEEGYRLSLVRLTDEDFETLEADQLIVQSMMSSRYVSTFEEDIGMWQRRLARVADAVTGLAEAQRMWSYLEPLFVKSDEVRRELPADAERFAGVDKDVRVVLTEAVTTKAVVATCEREGLARQLSSVSERLDMCKRALSEFLEGKRRAFPRFYFVSEADLLDILANGASPAKIAPHIAKVFPATSALVFEEPNPKAPPNTRPTACGWVAGVGSETMDFRVPFLLDGRVEAYLLVVLENQRSTLKANLKASLERYPTQERVEWLLARRTGTRGGVADAAQVAIVIAGVRFAGEVERCFKELEKGKDNAMKDLRDAQLRALGDLIRLTRTDMARGDRTRAMALITMDAHARDVVSGLLREGIKSPTAFQWVSQLRMRFVGDNVAITVCDASFDYGLEYLGNGPRLVVTPLTDRIYVTATQVWNVCSRVALHNVARV